MGNASKEIPSAERLELGSLLDIARLQAMCEHLNAVDGFPMALLTPEGEILVAAGWQDICTKFHRTNPESAKRCRESDAYIKEHLGSERYTAYKCRNNLWDIAFPIMVEGMHIATLFVGQFFYEGEELDLEAFRRQAEEFGFDWDEYHRALAAVPFNSKERVEHVLEFYRYLVAELASSGLALLKRKRAEERLEASLREKETLIKEIHHRVKNNLNVIVSLIGLQLDKEPDPALADALGRTKGRIFAISLMYELLYRQADLSRIDVGEYLRALSDNFHELYARPGLSVRERIEADLILLDVNRAVPCGIVVGELLANAYKHAFADRVEGSIEIVAKVSDGRVRIRVADDGIGGNAAAIASSATTLGMSLVRSVTEDQLKGELAFRSEGGFACEFAFQLDGRGAPHD